MSQADWAEMANSLNTAIVTRDPSGGYTPPNGGGAFIFGYHSIATADGAVAKYVNLANFNPVAATKGGQVTGAILKGPGGITQSSAFLFICAVGADVMDKAYMIGLNSNDPSSIKVYKGPLVNGIPATDPAAAADGKTLLTSDQAYVADEWIHVRMDAIVQPSGDVLIKCYQNDLVANPVTAPVWVALPGCESFVDDVLGVKSGTLPFDGGYLGHGFEVGIISRVAQFDFVKFERQT